MLPLLLAVVPLLGSGMEEEVLFVVVMGRRRLITTFDTHTMVDLIIFMGHGHCGDCCCWRWSWICKIGYKISKIGHIQSFVILLAGEIERDGGFDDVAWPHAHGQTYFCGEAEERASEREICNEVDLDHGPPPLPPTYVRRLCC